MDNITMNEVEKCKNSNVGDYNCYEEVEAPEWAGQKTLCMDKCLVEEIRHLWSLGIRTTGCCCGKHTNSTSPGYVGVVFEDIPKMKALGYEVQFNPCRPKDEDTFYIKTEL